uniref:Uncharacterized protein eiMSLSOrf39 n=1 Tax=Edwardsiella phage eiMSLS TaxID=945085 RepID=E7EL34_9VIRU|nr:unknown [Edwardsiella phage eiMSLS]
MNEFESALFIDLDKAVTTTKELHAENEALRTRLAAADSLIAELKQREADRLSGVFSNATGEPCIAMPVDLGLRALEETRELLAASDGKYERLARDVHHHYCKVFGDHGRDLTDDFYGAAVARLAQYAKAGYRLNNAMAEVETATRQYESLSGPHAFTVDIVAEITERADRRAAKAGVEPIGINGTLDAKKLSRDYRINDKIAR